MIRSFDYAADSALHKAGKVHPDCPRTDGPLGQDLASWMSAEFLKAYRGRRLEFAAEHDPAETRPALLDLLRLDKALFELRATKWIIGPDWVRIPLQGLLHLIRSGD